MRLLTYFALSRGLLLLLPVVVVVAVIYSRRDPFPEDR